MKVFFLVVVALYILYLIFLVVRACSELKNMPYSGISKSRTRVPCLLDRHIYSLLCLTVTRSPAQVPDSTDICGPGYKVSLGEGVFSFHCLDLIFNLSSQHGHPLPEVRRQGSAEQLCSRTVNPLSKLYPSKI